MGQLRHDLVRLEPGGELMRDHRVRFWLEADLRRGRRNERFLGRPDMAWRCRSLPLMTQSG